MFFLSMLKKLKIKDELSICCESNIIADLQ